MSDREEIGNHYSKYFRMVNVNTEELKSIAYKLRYRVYVEAGIIEKFRHDGFDEYDEYDEYDEHALHCLLFHKPSNQAIGYIRLIPQIKNQNKQLPIEQYYGKPFDFTATRVKKMKGANIGEISRLAIISSFRRRISDDFCLGENSPKQSENTAYTNQRFSINYLPMCLMSAAMHFAYTENMEYGLAMVEPQLAILLRRLGVQFDQIGKPFEYFGTRIPYVFYREHTYKNLIPEFRSLFDKISGELSEQNVIKNSANINAR